MSLAGDKPDFVVVIADDCTFRDLEVYGAQAKTPHLNRLASDAKFTQTLATSRKLTTELVGQYGGPLANSKYKRQ